MVIIFEVVGISKEKLFNFSDFGRDNTRSKISSFSDFEKGVIKIDDAILLPENTWVRIHEDVKTKEFYKQMYPNIKICDGMIGYVVHFKGLALSRREYNHAIVKKNFKKEKTTSLYELLNDVNCIAVLMKKQLEDFNELNYIEILSLTEEQKELSNIYLYKSHMNMHGDFYYQINDLVEVIGIDTRSNVTKIYGFIDENMEIYNSKTEPKEAYDFTQNSYITYHVRRATVDLSKKTKEYKVGVTYDVSHLPLFVPNELFGWICYMLLLCGSIVFNRFIGLWIIITIFWIIVRNKLRNDYKRK